MLNLIYVSFKYDYEKGCYSNVIKSFKSNSELKRFVIQNEVYNYAIIEGTVKKDFHET